MIKTANHPVRFQEVATILNMMEVVAVVEEEIPNQQTFPEFVRRQE